MGLSVLYRRWVKFEYSATKVMVIVAGMSLVIMTLATIADIIGRAFKHPITGTYEVVELLLAPAVFWGFAYAHYVGGHIRITILHQKLPARVQVGFDAVAGIVGGTFIALISWHLFLWAWAAMLIREITAGAVNFPVYPFKFIAALGFVPFALLFFEDGIRNLVSTINWRRS